MSEFRFGPLLGSGSSSFHGMQEVVGSIRISPLDKIFLSIYVPALFFMLDKETMDWNRAIERNSEALKDIVAALFTMLELAGEATVARIPQTLHSAVLRVLRPAESAVRRLVVIAARGLVVKLAPSRPMPAGQSGRADSHVPRFSSSIRAKASQARTAEHSRGILRASISSETIPGWRPCGQHPSP